MGRDIILKPQKLEWLKNYWNIWKFLKVQNFQILQDFEIIVKSRQDLKRFPGSPVNSLAVDPAAPRKFHWSPLIPPKFL